MKKLQMYVCGVASLMAVAGTATATTIRIDRAVAGGSFTFVDPSQYSQPGLQINVSEPSTDNFVVSISVGAGFEQFTAWRVTTVSTFGTIASVTFTGTTPIGASQYSLLVGGASTTSADPTEVLGPAADDVVAVGVSTGSAPVEVRVAARDAVGSVGGNSVARVQAGGPLTGTVLASTGAISLVVADSIGTSTQPATISATTTVGTVTTNETTGTGGDIFAAITGPNGVATVLARGSLNGSITAGGTSPITLVQGKTGVGSATDAFDLTGPGIQTLTAGGFDQDGLATIAGDFHLAANLTGPITRMRAVRFNGSGGDFNGTLTASSMTNSLSDRIVIDDEHKGTITFTQSGGNKDVIIVGRSAAGSAPLINFPSGGFAGQVVVNRDNATAAWTAAAFNGVVGLSPVPDYANLSASLGGGAIGVGPYRLHREDCVPSNTPFPLPSPYVNTLGFGSIPDAATWEKLKVVRNQFDDLPSAQDDQEVRLRWYGPIIAGPCQPVTIQRSDVPAMTNLVNVTDLFDPKVIGPQDSNLVRDLRLRRVCAEFSPLSGVLPFGYYRVIRNVDLDPGLTNGVTSKLIDGEPEVAQMAMYFHLGGCSRADVAGPNQSTIPDVAITADDIIVFLGWYFANDLRADFAGPNQSTLPDGTLSADDIIVFLNLYFAGCDSSELPRSCAKGEPSPCQSIIGGEGERAGAAALGSPAASTAPATGGTNAQAPAEQVAALEAMIAAESDPQRRATLQAALAILQAASAVNDSE